MEATVTTPETDIAVEGLDLDAVWAYRIIIILVNPTEEFVGYYLYFNGDHVDTAYWRQFIAADDEMRTSGRRNDSRLIGIEPGQSALVEGILARCPDGLVRASVSVNRGAPAEVLAIAHKIVWAVPANVTKVEVEADVEGGVGAGSRLILMNTGIIAE